MSKIKIFTNRWARAFGLALVLSALVLQPVSADVAPPEPPPGVIISPGQEQTQVRMVSELVTLTVLEASSQARGEAKTEATFLMRNLGTADEQLDVRFPLVFGESAYYREQFPEIQNIRVTVDGKSVATTRQLLDTEFGADLPWAVFPVNPLPPDWYGIPAAGGRSPCRRTGNYRREAASSGGFFAGMRRAVVRLLRWNRTAGCRASAFPAGGG